MGDASDELMHAIYEASEEYGFTLSAGEQVAVARRIASAGESISASSIDQVFVDQGLRRPPAGMSSSIRRRWDALGRSRSLLDVILDYRQFAIGHLSRQFGTNTKGHETELRNNLHTYLPEHGFKEAQSGKGNTDIVIPSRSGNNRPEAIIETKVWKGASDYEDGLVELATYIHNEKPNQAIYVVFGDRTPTPSVVADPTAPLVERRTLSGVIVPVVAVLFEVVYPSKVRQTARKQTSGQS